MFVHVDYNSDQCKQKEYKENHSFPQLQLCDVQFIDSVMLNFDFFEELSR